MTPTRRDKILQVLRTRQPDLTLITDRIIKERNLAALLRICDAIGIACLHCTVPLSDYQTYAGTSASANKWVETEHYGSVVTPINKLREDGFQVVAARLSETAEDYRSVDYTKPTAVLLGAEIEGVSEEAINFCDKHITIPMMGMVESYNVSVAAGIILAEAQSQRQAAGAYRERSLDESEFQRLFFKWSYPKLANYCDEHNLAYPPLDESGDLIPGTAPSGIE